MIERTPVLNTATHVILAMGPLFLLLPLEVRIVPTYAVAANAVLTFQTRLDLSGITWVINALSGIEVTVEWNRLNSDAIRIMPLVATAISS